MGVMTRFLWSLCDFCVKLRCRIFDPKLYSLADWECLCRPINGGLKGPIKIKRSKERDTDKFRVATLAHLARMRGYEADITDKSLIISPKKE